MDGRKRNCYEHNLNGSFAPHEKFCQLLFDGYLCWKATKAGHVAEQLCPSDQLTDSIIFTHTARRQCDTTGNWYNNSQQNSSFEQCDLKTYSNGTAVMDINKELDVDFLVLYSTWMPYVKCINYYGYWISLITLLFCVLILISIKKLHCTRNTLHVHLFMSFIFRATAFLIKSSTLIQGLAMKSDLITGPNGEVHYITENFNWVCKAVISTWLYFMQANYMFILMEGIYLHNLMFLNLFSENSSVRLYYLSGWGIPAFFISSWAVLRLMYDNKMCWTTKAAAKISWLVQGPIDLSVLINFGLFLSITRILCIKIKTMYVQHNKIKYRRLIRSTLTLLLIYAVPYAISLVFFHIVSYFQETIVELIWLSYDQIFTAFQGLFMGLIYCLLNSEVRTEVKQKIQSIRYYHVNSKRARACRTISNTMQFTIPVPSKDELDARRNAGNYRSTENL